MKNKTRVCLYSEYPSLSLDVDLVSEALSSYGFFTENRGNLFDFLSLSEKDIHTLAKDFSSAIVPDITLELNVTNPPGQVVINSELNKLSGRQDLTGNLYDGFWIQRSLYRLFSEKVSKELNSQYIHIILTGRLFGTFEDRRYHARVVLMGEPSLISTSGLIEAPAKPREYYYVKGRMIQSGHDVSGLDEMYKGRYVEYDDPKITSIIISYVLQVIFYVLTGEAFCDNSKCCLSNSHWQEEVLNVQFEGKLCDKCKTIVEKKRKEP